MRGDRFGAEMMTAKSFGGRRRTVDCLQRTRSPAATGPVLILWGLGPPTGFNRCRFRDVFSLLGGQQSVCLRSEVTGNVDTKKQLQSTGSAVTNTDVHQEDSGFLHLRDSGDGRCDDTAESVDVGGKRRLSGFCEVIAICRCARERLTWIGFDDFGAAAGNARWRGPTSPFQRGL